MSGARGAAGLPWTVAGDAVIVTVRLTPRGGRDAIDGVELLADGTAVLKVRVRAAPSEGAANAALIALLAKLFKVARGQIAFIAGETARIKRLRISSTPAERDGVVATLRAYAPARSTA